MAILLAGVAIVAVIVFVAVFSGGDGDDTDVETTASTTADQTATTAADQTATTAAATPAEGSAAGKPCVPMADAPPAGAPSVPVKVGPPPTELITEDLKVGDGLTVDPGATVSVNYIGVSCSTGKIFDDSYSRGQPAEFPLDGVIEGWTKGIPGMKVNGQRLLGIPAAEAYGARGSPPDIAPDEALWFVVEVQGTKPV